MDNRHGLVVGAVATRASGHAERLAALSLIEPFAERPRPVTLAADKGYDSGEFVMECRERAVTPHIAQNQNGAALGDRRPYHPPPRLRRIATPPQTHRGSLRLGQDGRRAAQIATPRSAQGRPLQRVCGTSQADKFTYDKVGKPVLMQEPKLVLNNLGASKIENFWLLYGRRPLAALGNSSSDDQQMLEYVKAGSGARLSAALLHDDAEREYAYGPRKVCPIQESEHSARQCTTSASSNTGLS